MDIYREQILDHYKHPHNFGHLIHPTNSSSLANSVCGDRMSMEVNVINGKITEIAFSGNGCAISLASASLLTEKAKGMKVSQVMKITTKNIESMLGTTLTPSRVKCATLSLEALQKALASKSR